MARFKIVNGVRIEFTAEEEIERDADEARAIEELPDIAREIRNNLLKSEVDPIVSNNLRWNDMTDAKRTEWTNYRQSLLDIEDLDGFPNDVVWPSKPT